MLGADGNARDERVAVSAVGGLRRPYEWKLAPRGTRYDNRAAGVGGNVPALRALLEAESPSRSEQRDRFSDPFLAGFGSLCRVNPRDEVTAIRRRQALEKLPGVGVTLEGGSDV